MYYYSGDDKHNRFKEYADVLPDDKELEKLFMEFLKSRFGMD